MRNAFHRLALLALVGVLPNAGCMSLLPKTSWTLPSLASAKPSGEENQTTLPPDQSSELCLRLAKEFEKSGKEVEAIIQYEKARQYDPSLKISDRLAVLYDRLGYRNQAHTEFEKALQANPNDPDLLNNLGFHYYNGGQWQQAEENFRKAIGLNANHKHAWMNLGLTLAQQQRYEESLEAFRKVVPLAHAYSNLAFVLTAQGNRDMAKQAYRMALREEPNLRIALAALQKLEESENGASSQLTPVNRTSNAPSAPNRPQMLPPPVQTTMPTPVLPNNDPIIVPGP